MESNGILNPEPPKPLRSRGAMAYAFERSCGLPPAAACRAAGGKVENGQATKWEASRGVQAWIAHYRRLGHTDEMLAAKRARIEQRLELAAYGDILDFATIEEMPIIVGFDDEGEPIRKLVKQPVIDWAKVKASPYSAIVSGFEFDKDTGQLKSFKRDDALGASAQLRDMHGFSAPKKLGIGNQQDGGAIEVSWKQPPAEGQQTNG